MQTFIPGTLNNLASHFRKYAHLYNAKLCNGFIDTRLKTMRSAASTKRKGKSEKEKTSSNCPVSKRARGNRRPELKSGENDDDDPDVNAEEAQFKVFAII